MVIKYKCEACGIVVSTQVFESDNFCSNCGRRLTKVYVETPGPKSDGPIKLRPEDVHVDALWSDYVSEPIRISAGFRVINVNRWISNRKQVYKEYREKFSPSNLLDLDAVKRNFGSWLLFRNNLSWTTLQRTASPALENLND